MKKILIVDDNPDMRSLLMDILEDRYQIVEADSGEGLIEKAKGENPDLIITDVMMRGMMSAYGAIEKLKLLGIRVPIILFSGIVKDERTHEILKPFPKSYFLSKPFDKNELLKKIEELLK